MMETAAELCRRAIDHEEGEEWDEAIACYTRAIELAPDWADAHLFRGVLHDQMGQLDKALVNFNQASRLSPADNTAKKLRAEARVERACGTGSKRNA